MTKSLARIATNSSSDKVISTRGARGFNATAMLVSRRHALDVKKRIIDANLTKEAADRKDCATLLRGKIGSTELRRLVIARS